ncbi:HAMP domain-containing histidine kinase [Waterburya agarophytonicola K14]|uniref:histidine kinase n=1 Tax=Waterburya agarophytonicola KI4 TaxID=2874699 RepID=A0A964FGF7_9CYAN|nr:HAMP domain-containing sensor histidine kinase [Waterburya agarophytonicola]MCC0178825.1 HAMP domain-containing histidine kinase [Waterburya agarophytonicola KI4]
MFQKIRYRLFLSNLLVLALVLLGSALAVRLVFISNLKQQASEKLMAIALSTAASAEVDERKFEWEIEFPPQLLEEAEQAFQWFDAERKLLEQQGNIRYISTLPFEAEPTVRNQIDDKGLEVITLPILDKNNQQLIGYLRATQSLEEVDETIARLDVGLAVGAIVATVLSSLGSGWLNRQAMEPIEESFERLKQFTADASHELRSPLMAISTNAEVALTYPEGMRSSDGDKFKAIALATDQMSQLTEDLLLLTRTDKVASFEFNKIDLTTLLTDLVSLYRPQAQGKQIKLKAKINYDLWLIGDEAKLARAFTNLIQNAIQYTPAGGEIEVSSNRLGREVVINIEDTGIGIAPEHLDLVFDRLWRGDRSRSYYQGGSGLGLAITQAIIYKHQGTVDVTSQIDIGTCFIVRLPIALASPGKIVSF